MRITDELVSMLEHFKPLYVNTHFNHPVELTPTAVDACARVVDAGIPVNNQAVLLRGVNDEPQLMEDLCRALVRHRVRPYYLFQCDLVQGVEHLRTPVARGLEIMEHLHARLGRPAVPDFVVDVPNGTGKIPLTPDYILSVGPSHTVLRNHQGTPVSYPEPADLLQARQTELAPVL
jgi:lysine 2,3-aminomutase